MATVNAPLEERSEVFTIGNNRSRLPLALAFAPHEELPQDAFRQILSRLDGKQFQ